MTNTLYVLLVEDEDTKIIEWTDALAAHNSDSDKLGFSIETVSAKTVVDAKQLLEKNVFDAVVVDLRLQVEPGFAESNTAGNELVRHVLQTQPIGVVIYTGQQAEVEAEHISCPQLQVMDKGDGLTQVFEWLKENLQVFIELREAKAIFNRETAKIFYKSIWPRWKYWNAGKEEGQKLSNVVTRHIFAHVHDSLLHDTGDATHSEESYFVPPLKTRLDTGDLVELDGKVWIIVSPRCDLANPGKVQSIVLAGCDDISAKWNSFIAAGSKKGDDQCKRLIQHDRELKQHFLFPLIGLDQGQRGPWMALFHDLKVIPAAEAEGQLTEHRFASLSPMFVPSLVERFGAYFSRIGTPGFSSD